ncbi:MAG: hypothetical protein ACO3NK_07545 [Prochlorotrichaceae cyanobacterium]
MTAIVPSVTFPDITHLLLESYLGTTTGILDWQNFRSIAPPDDGSLAYAGAIWPNQYTGEPAALRNRKRSSTRWGIRLQIAGADVEVVTLRAHQWARVLDRLLESVTTLEGQEREGADLEGTYEELEVANNTTIALTQTPWTIIVDENESGGAVAIVSSSFTVINSV